MPSNILNADTGFPHFTGRESNEEKFGRITNYLTMLLEQLRYSMGNLSQENFNAQGLEEIAQMIRKPVMMQLEDNEGRMTALQATAQGLDTRITNAEGNIAQVTASAVGLTSRITDAEGNISSLQQTAAGLTSRVTDAEGNLTTLRQTVNGMTLEVSNGSASSTLKLLAGSTELSSANIHFTGMVTYSALAGSGTTIINGDNITTGTIEAINVKGCDIEGSIFASVLKSNGAVGGEIECCYLDRSNIAGGIRLDDQGGGTGTQSRYRMYVYTRQVQGVGFALKLESAAGLSIEAVKNVYIRGAESVTLSGTRVDLYGEVYVNGKKIE